MIEGKKAYEASIEPGHYEKSLLDRALDNYSRLARQYYRKLNELDNAPVDVRKVRQDEVAKIKRGLELQRMTAEVMAVVQAGIDKYREDGRSATQGVSRSEIAAKQKALLAEGHHDGDLRLLEQFMIADARPRPDSRHTAHHVVPGKGKTKAANLARVRLHRFGIRINDPDNGVWLPTYKKHTPRWSMPDALGHLEYHTEGYEDWVRRSLEIKTGEVPVRMELRRIGLLLQQNKLPQEARKKQA